MNSSADSAGDVSEALCADLEGALPLSAGERAALSQLGTRLVGMRRFDEARCAYELLLAADPDNAFYHRAFGICCENLDRLEEAKASLDRAIEMDPDDAFARVGRATVRMRNGDRAGAMEDLKIARQSPIDPTSALARRIAIMTKAATRTTQPTPQM